MNVETNDQARGLLALNKITSNSVTLEQVKALRKILTRRLKLSGIYGGSAKLCRAKKDFKYIEMQTNQWVGRECVSFNSDGFIGFAGWADTKNGAPIIEAVEEWAEGLVSK